MMRRLEISIFELIEIKLTKPYCLFKIKSKSTTTVLPVDN